MYTNLPKSCLVGIVLTISSHSGPQVVYHYPPLSEPIQLTKDKLVPEGGNGIHVSAANKFRTSQSEDAAYNSVSSSSDTASDATSGLSDSDLSTDYADFSDSSSQSDSSSECVSGAAEGNDAESNVPSPFPMDSSYNQIPDSQSVLAASLNAPELTSTKPKSVKSRHSQISATKLFQYLANNSDGGESRQPSIFSKLTSNEDTDTLRLIEHGNTYDGESILSLEAGLENVDVNDIMDSRIFQSEYFQDTSKILNFNAEFVAEICSPPKEMCNTRFEFTVDELCFLGLPIHVDDKGRWRRKKRKRNPNNTRSRRSESAGVHHTIGSDVKTSPIAKQEQDEMADGEASDHTPCGSAKANDEEPGGPTNNQLDEIEDLQKAANMFHVCFIMNPQLIEYNERVDDMYHYIVTRLSLILRYIQDKTGYVIKECAKILRTKDRVLKRSKTLKSLHGQGVQGKYLYKCILKSSSLARALTKCFHSIVNNEIVTLHIGNNKVLSLQIPIKNEFANLPDLKTNPVLRGSFLSSILNTKFLGYASEVANGESSILTEHDGIFQADNDILDYALLLLDEAPNIIKDLENSSLDNDFSNLLMVNLVKILKATVPLRSYLYLVDQLLGLNSSAPLSGGGSGPSTTPAVSVNDSSTNSFRSNVLRSIALHLTYWRHARIVLPISSKNTYIVSPLAPIRGTSIYDIETGDLGITEGKAMIYQNQELFHSKFPTLPTLPSFLSTISNAKPRSFGHVIPSKDHEYLYLNALSWLIRYGYLTQLFTFIWIRVDRSIKIAVDEDLEREGVRKWNSKSTKEHINPHDNVATVKKTPDSVSTADSKVSSGAADIEGNGESDYSDAPESMDDNMFEGLDYTIILEPKTATALEKRWLYKCVEGQPAELQMLFRRVVKYCNGRTPLEWMILKEIAPKHELKRLLVALGDYAVQVRHW
ncbi:HGL035Wp [Eremothecium sinecaudum]|uniref:Nitrogen permease regulator 3 n=1 Tax=Eremothecium sinecaudum TaxID=45286 RepID=A0A120K2Q8_9SACH|nr:HGL035Wp [Eremothecium sinecaudum]AMD22305.1 HGL035Wp [Eremothecium sinecaudum]